MSSETARLIELIEITRDGEHFYAHAAAAVKDPSLARLFNEMAQGKRRLIEVLALTFAAHDEEPPRGGTLIGALRRHYSDARASLAGADQSIYVKQLAEAEERLLRAFDEARRDASAELQQLLDRELPQVRACHARMQELKALSEPARRNLG